MMHATLTVWILSAVICVASSHPQNSASNSVSLVTAANKDFAFSLYRKLAAHADAQDKNVFYSPASVSVALAALSVGARGETHRQLFSGLGFNNTLLTQADVDQAFHTLLERSNSNQDTNEGTAVFVDDHFKARPEFLETLKQSYFTDGFSLDFAKTTESADAINKYVNDKTNGKIEKLVDSLDENTVMYLISYIYFKGKWQTPFEPQSTRKDEFIVDANTKVPVQMMHMEETVDTYYDETIKTSVLHLPFNSSYSMLLLLPDDMTLLEEKICPTHVNNWMKHMNHETYEIYVPKFSIKTSYELKDVLTQMGMTDMFGDSADLTGIAEGQKLAVSKFTMMPATLRVWILTAVICVLRSHSDHAEAVEEQDSASNSVSLVTAANKDFAFSLYRKLAAHADAQDKNVFYSPASVSVALAALSVGARGETHRQLFSGLGFNNTLLTQADVDQAFHTLLERSNSNQDTNEGTAVFVDDLFKPRPEFLETLKQSYFTDGFSLDFAKTTESADAINKYVNDKTNGKIEKLVEQVNENTVMYLISYIYFKGKWQTPFKPQATREDEFFVDANTKVPVQMMYMRETLDVYNDRALNTSVLHLPFNSSYSMLLLLPDDMTVLEETISSGHVTGWLKLMTSRTYEIYVPKFSIKTSYELNDVLTEMGMTDMFGGSADLTGIAEGERLSVSEVVHKASLDVDEGGATAAAATGIRIMLTSARLEVIPVLKFNRPFMAIITERNTENILFMGKIINPNI
ncbi:uncharacterized protein V6R79_015192 [Siganus canaliculatus]